MREREREREKYYSLYFCFRRRVIFMLLIVVLVKHSFCISLRENKVLITIDVVRIVPRICWKFSIILPSKLAQNLYHLWLGKNWCKEITTVQIKLNPNSAKRLSSKLHATLQLYKLTLLRKLKRICIVNEWIRNDILIIVNITIFLKQFWVFRKMFSKAVSRSSFQISIFDYNDPFNRWLPVVCGLEQSYS